MRKKVTIIANPFSGTSRKENLRQQLLKANNDFFDLDIVYTEHAGHARELVDEAIWNGSKIIVAAGGDGTVNEVASQLYSNISKDDLLLGILPGGSGNGFAMHLGLGRDTIKAFDFIKRGKFQKVDTCLVNEKFFINVSGIGFDARIAYLTKKSSSRGFLRYFKSTMSELKNFSMVDAKITTDQGVFEGKYAAIIVANATMYGYNFTIAPTAAIDDGLFDVILLKEAPLYSYLYNSYRMLSKSIHKSPFAQSLKTSFVKIECETSGGHYHIDGEGFKLKQALDYKIVSKSLNVIVGF
jgi:diacylglycerol kinase (ATP)